jgi:hypothetical protein
VSCCSSCISLVSADLVGPGALHDIHASPLLLPCQPAMANKHAAPTCSTYKPCQLLRGAPCAEWLVVHEAPLLNAWGLVMWPCPCAKGQLLPVGTSLDCLDAIVAIPGRVGNVWYSKGFCRRRVWLMSGHFCRAPLPADEPPIAYCIIAAQI